MSNNISNEELEPEEATIDALLAELQRTMDKQFQAVADVESKAGILFGATGVLILVAVGQAPILWRLAPAPGQAWLIGSAAAFAILAYLRVIYYLRQALRSLHYALPLAADRELIQREFLLLPSAKLKKQLLSNYIECSKHNGEILGYKERWVDACLRALIIGILYLLVLVLIGVGVAVTSTY